MDGLPPSVPLLCSPLKGPFLDGRPFVCPKVRALLSPPSPAPCPPPQTQPLSDRGANQTEEHTSLQRATSTYLNSCSRYAHRRSQSRPSRSSRQRRSRFGPMCCWRRWVGQYSLQQQRHSACKGSLHKHQHLQQDRRSSKPGIQRNKHAVDHSSCSVFCTHVAGHWNRM